MSVEDIEAEIADRQRARRGSTMTEFVIIFVVIALVVGVVVLKVALG